MYTFRYELLGAYHDHLYMETLTRNLAQIQEAAKDASQAASAVAVEAAASGSADGAASADGASPPADTKPDGPTGTAVFCRLLTEKSK